MLEGEAITLLVDLFFGRGIALRLPLSEWGRNRLDAAGLTKAGTTATEVPDAHGTFARPVYYDWAVNWPRVKAVFEEASTQRILHLTIAHFRGASLWNRPADDYSCPMMAYSRDLKWPYFHQREINRQDHGEGPLIKNMLAADSAAGQRLCDAALPPLRDILIARLHEVEEAHGMSWFAALGSKLGWGWPHVSAEVLRHSMEASLSVEPSGETETESLGEALQSALSRAPFGWASPASPGGSDAAVIAWRRWEEAKTRWLQEHLDQPLLLQGSSHEGCWAAFLAYKLAWELAPPSASLRILACGKSLGNKLVYDATHNVFYDLARCFTNTPATSLLSEVRLPSTPDPP
jgi:hypothetical protein